MALYLHGLPASSHLAGTLRTNILSPEHFLRMVEYLVAYLGLPLSRSPAMAMAGRLVGSLLLVGGSILVLRFTLWRGNISRLDRLAVALILLALGSAVAAAVARVDAEPDIVVPVRYTPFVSMLHVGLLCLAVPRIGGWAQGLYLRKCMQLGGFLALTLVAAQIAIGQAAARTVSEIKAKVEGFYRGERSADLRVVYPDLLAAADIVAAMRRAGLHRDTDSERPGEW
jgi:hypothetical protein